MEIIRRDELQELLDVVRMKPYGKILITGAAGSGKTFLLNIIGKILEEQGRKIWYETMVFSQMGNKIWKHSSDFTDVVCLVDGLDEIYRYKQQMVENIKNARGCYICTARENKFDINFDYEIRLKPLTDKQILLFISDYLGARISSDSIVEGIFKELDKQNLTPRTIAEKLHTKLKGEGLNEYFLDFEKDIHQIYTYKGGVSLQHPEIVVPERKIIRVPDEIKNDIKVVTHSLVDKVALRPEILQEITPRQFEELVCELFERKGYNVQLTKQTRDGGKDLIVLNNSVLGDLVIYAECKKKAPKHPVNVGLVRQLYGMEMLLIEPISAITSWEDYEYQGHVNRIAADEATEQKTLSEREQKIYNMICENLHLSVEQVMAELDISRSTVFRDYAKIKKVTGAVYDKKTSTWTL